MDYDAFIGDVHNRARVATREEAVKAIRSTLQTLSERLTPDQSENLAAELPEEIGFYLTLSDGADRFDLDSFFDRVAGREQVDKPDAVHHARSVMATMQQAVTPGRMEKIRGALPEDYAALFESGSEGELA